MGYELAARIKDKSMSKSRDKQNWHGAGILNFLPRVRCGVILWEERKRWRNGIDRMHKSCICNKIAFAWMLLTEKERSLEFCPKKEGRMEISVRV